MLVIYWISNLLPQWIQNVQKSLTCKQWESPNCSLGNFSQVVLISPHFQLIVVCLWLNQETWHKKGDFLWHFLMKMCNIPWTHLTFDHKILSQLIAFNGSGGTERPELERSKMTLIFSLQLVVSRYLGSWRCWKEGRPLYGFL